MKNKIIVISSKGGLVSETAALMESFKEKDVEIVFIDSYFDVPHLEIKDINDVKLKSISQSKFFRSPKNNFKK